MAKTESKPKNKKKLEFVECPECKGKDESCSMCGGRGTIIK